MSAAAEAAAARPVPLLPESVRPKLSLPPNFQYVALRTKITTQDTYQLIKIEYIVTLTISDVQFNIYVSKNNLLNSNTYFNATIA